MTNKDCLRNQDLILAFYEEPSCENVQKQHLANCPICAEKLLALRADLAQLPDLDYAPDRFANTRMAAKVLEKIRRPKRSKLLPAIGIAASATVALVMTFLFLPQPQVDQFAQTGPASIPNIAIEDSMPDIDFLEDLEILQDLELLSQIEGV